VPTAYPTITNVTIDGRITNRSEWRDTTEFAVEEGNKTIAYFRAKYDTDYLYTLFDFLECSQPFKGNSTYWGNQVYLYFDPLSVRSSSPDPSMYGISVYCDSSTIFVCEGDASGGWTPFYQTNVTGMFRKVRYAPSPHSEARHMIMELRIPLLFASLKSHMQGTIGFAFGLYDGRTDTEVWYPSEWQWKEGRVPSTMGTLEYSQIPIPEFSPTLVMSISMVVLCVFVIARKRCKK